MPEQPPPPSRAPALRTLWTRHRWLTLSFLLVTAFAIFFAVRSLIFLVYWHNHADEPLAGWMTIRYVAHSYRVDPRLLHDALDLPPGHPDRRPLIEISRDHGLSLDATATILLDAIRKDRAAPDPPLPPAAPARP